MHWLLLSPGLNPMEQVWVFLKEQTGRLLKWPMNTVQLHQEIKCQFNLLPEAFCHCQISSMPATGVSWSWTVLVAIKLWKTHSRLLLSIGHNSAFLWFCTTFMLTSIFKIVLLCFQNWNNCLDISSYYKQIKTVELNVTKQRVAFFSWTKLCYSYYTLDSNNMNCQGILRPQNIVQLVLWADLSLALNNIRQNKALSD